MNENASQNWKSIMHQILLRDDPPKTTHNVFNTLVHTCTEQDVKFDATAAVEYWWHLARLGVIALAKFADLRPHRDLREVVLTERGRHLLELGQKSPHDPDKYCDAVRERVGGDADRLAMTYLDEAVGAWTAGLDRASVVMLGVACERLVFLLVQAIIAAGIEPWSAKMEKMLTRDYPKVSPLFELVRKCLTQLRTEGKLPGPLGDAIDRRLSAIFDHARGLRNNSGHPTGVEVSHGDAEAGLLLFPDFYALVHDLCRHLPTPPEGPK